MKISTKWVEQFTTIEIEREELIRRIGSQLGAIESVEDWGSYFDNQIVVAEIVRADDHPDADKLGVYELSIGGDNLVTVCAGDKTLQHGDKVGYIPPGANVPKSVKQVEPFEIQERDLRGVTTQGMMGSARELLFSENHDGVAKLDTDASAGTPLADVYDLDDLIIDVENKMFTHRPDLFGIIGIAREISGIQGLAFNSPDWYKEAIEFPEPTAELSLKIKNEIPELCPRFSAITLAGVSIHDSPLIMQSYLSRVGLRPINNVVDVTNFGMYLTAQPTHAFDYDKVAKLSKAEPTIIIRKPKSNEKIKLLDGREIAPHSDTAMVATDNQLISVGGSMGGADTEVDGDTKNVILEAASWDLYSIRRTSFTHGIFTDAVTRFSKGQSARQTLPALRQMLDLFVKNTGAKLASQLIDDFPSESGPVEITISSDFVNARLGSTFSADEIAKTLSNVEIPSRVEADNVVATIPFWRTDLELKEDLVEEVGRINGYDNLPVDVPLRKSKPNFRTDELRLKGRLRQILSAAGARDVITYNFVSSDLFVKAGYSDELVETAYRIRNSLSPDLEFMRISLLPSITEKVNPNVRAGYGSFALFEVNKSHNKEQQKDGLPEENLSLALTVASDRSQNGSAYYQAKAYLSFLVKQLGQDITVRRESDGDLSTPLGHSVKSLFAKNRIAAVEVDGKFAGFVGEYSAQTKQRFKLPKYSAGFEIDASVLRDEYSPYTAISRFPASTQDVTLSTPDEIEYGDLEHLVLRSLESEEFDVSVQPISIYRAENTAQRRITFRLTFRSDSRTLKTSEINQAISEMVAKTTDMGIEQI